MKRKTKMITGFALAFMLLLNIFMPTVSVIAIVSGDITITFNGPWECNDVTVTANYNGEQTINADDEITLTNFDPETMRAYIHASDDFEADLVVDNGITRLSTVNCDSFPQAATLEFRVEPQGNNNPGDPPVSNDLRFDFHNYTINGNVVTYNLGEAVVTLTVNGANIDNNGEIVITNRNDLDNISFTVGGDFDSEKMNVVVSGQNQGQHQFESFLIINGNTATFDEGVNLPNGVLFISIRSTEDEGGDPEPGIVGGEDDIEFDILFEGTHMNAWINNKVIMDDHEELQNTFIGTIENAGTEDPNETNELRFIAPFGDKPVIKYIINNIEYEEGDEGVQIDSQDGQWHITVPGATKYTVRGVIDENFIVPRTVIWVNPDYVPKDAADAEWVSDFTIEHGYARAIAIYDDQDRQLLPEEYTNEHGDEYGIDNGFGWVCIYPGYRVIFEFEPEYGYQLTDIRINETPITFATETPNQYEFEMVPDSGNIHFAATFTPTDNSQTIGNNAEVSSVDFVLDNDVIKSGTARLSIDKVNEENLDENQINGFEEIAGNNYEISTYLDIDLTQIWYKGKNDADDVWTREIYDLEGKNATITVTLDEGITPEDVIILHEIHDGETIEGYEAVNIVDKDFNNGVWTVTFMTSSFSNFAVASKKNNAPATNEVTFNTKGGSNVASQIVASGEKATIPEEDPKKEGFIFDGWFADETCKFAFNFNDPITMDTVIYAKWAEPITVTYDANGGTPGIDWGNSSQEPKGMEWDSIPDSIPENIVTAPTGYEYAGLEVNGVKYYKNTQLDTPIVFDSDSTVKVLWSEIVTEYKILNGADQKIEVDKDEDLVVRANGDVSKFTMLKIDGVAVNKSNYLITPGSTIATISKNFLKTLSKGVHTLTFVYTDGEISTNFTIAKANTESKAIENETTETNTDNETTKLLNPTTGDNIGIYIIILSVGLIGLAQTIKIWKNSKDRRH